MQQHQFPGVRPTILVTGATGAQGGSVARALLNTKRYTVRCLTRDTGSEKAQQLKKEGAELVEGDLNDKDSLLDAMKGCYGVFGLTNFWEHYEQEFHQGRNLIDAVRDSGISHFVYSGLPSYVELSSGKFAVPHCDIKASLENYTRSLDLPASFVHIAFYYENFLSFFPPRKGADGNFYFGFPQGDTRLAMASVEDIGKIVTQVFACPGIYLHRTVGVVGEDRSCKEYAAIMSRVLGVTIRYNHIQRDAYAGMGFPGAEELANMFEVQRLYIPRRSQHLMESYCMHPGMQSLEAWLTKNKQQFLQLLNETEYA
ncbi:MAG: NmrA/HSCARG family protein [Bacteroidetes bacterium]|nr:NmrA/HSCARG family protein [Bacteroidota bacterium]